MTDALAPKFEVFEKKSDADLESSVDNSEQFEKKGPQVETLVETDSNDAETETKGKWLRFVDKAIKFLEVKQRTNLSSTSDHRAESFIESFLYNDDLRPVESKRRVWDWKQYISFLVSGALNVNTLETCVIGLQLGLTWWQTWIMSSLGFTCVAVYVTLAARVGNMYHISFPITARVSFGIYFSIWIVINRVVMAVVWYGVQTYIGSQAVQIMLKSIFGNDLEQKVHNTFNSPNVTTFQFMCFMLFWGAQLPALWFSPHTLRHLFVTKTVITPIALIAFLIWVVKRSDGHLALGSLTSEPPSKSLLGWAYVRSMMAALDNFSTLILNTPDFTRFAKTPRSSIYPQLLFIPVLYSVLGIIGIIIASAAFHIYHVNYWNPLDVLSRFLDHYTSGTRAGAFFISTSFALAQLGTNVASNSISAGTDMTALFPKFINIRRGSYICAAISLAICPWNLMATSSKFTTVLSAYAVFLSSVSGVIAADYYVVRKGVINLHHCYTNKLGTLYMYNRFGTNWRAVVAYVIGMIPNFPGFVGSIGPHVPIGAMKLFYLNYFVGWGLSFLVYVGLCYYSPVEGMPKDVKLFERVWLEKWAEVEHFNEERKELQENDYNVDSEFLTTTGAQLHDSVSETKESSTREF
ncbi:uridine permease [Kluyveromyces marxianus]|uniref:Uridine permease n=2 Tax=Kluyveromyces marxianus TaxID=4911 RepID=W0TGK9_KLUMD|nr:uridine permease [Kluyveromyces marxianus DMKU3-1042]QGN18070.1 uridine permease [Kluyveromyces marxianus]BAO41931.1 uridine permease [Kluyveromyces marxianus DMKU3-1042]BAP73355.1 uridine permease [Kluyveromyces marxianus]